MIKLHLPSFSFCFKQDSLISSWTDSWLLLGYFTWRERIPSQVIPAPKQHVFLYPGECNRSTFSVFIKRGDIKLKSAPWILMTATWNSLCKCKLHLPCWCGWNNKILPVCNKKNTLKRLYNLWGVDEGKRLGEGERVGTGNGSIK